MDKLMEFAKKAREMGFEGKVFQSKVEGYIVAMGSGFTKSDRYEELMKEAEKVGGLWSSWTICGELVDQDPVRIF